jgi:hypothetical protein
MPYRIMSVMQNTILMAVPLFIFMGIVLQKTKLAEQLLEAMGDLLAKQGKEKATGNPPIGKNKVVPTMTSQSFECPYIMIFGKNYSGYNH